MWAPFLIFNAEGFDCVHRKEINTIIKTTRILGTAFILSLLPVFIIICYLNNLKRLNVFPILKAADFYSGLAHLYVSRAALKVAGHGSPVSSLFKKSAT